MFHQSSILVVLFWLFTSHPFFVSVCEIEHRAEGESLQITHKIFWDDLEKGLKQEYNQSYNLLKVKDTLALNQQLNAYLQKNFEIKINPSNSSIVEVMGKYVYSPIMSFKVINEEFDCKNCNTHNGKLSGSCRNHCTKCLFSLVFI